MKIAAVLYRGLTALDAVGAYEILCQLPHSQVTFVSSRRGPVQTDKRMLRLGAEATFSELPSPDIVLVPGGLLGTLAATKNQELLTWLRQAHQTSQWTLSVCTGSLILGAAGLLKGLTATTHWAAQDRLKPFGATYVPERYVRHGKIITAAGVSAGIDMALYVAGEIVGEASAQSYQLAIEYDPQPPYHSGSLPQAAPETVKLARQGLRRVMRREFGAQLREKVSHPFRSDDLWPDVQEAEPG